MTAKTPRKTDAKVELYRVWRQIWYCIDVEEWRTPQHTDVTKRVALKICSYLYRGVGGAVGGCAENKEHMPAKHRGPLASNKRSLTQHIKQISFMVT